MTRPTIPVLLRGPLRTAGGFVPNWLLKIEFSTDDAAPLTDPYVGEVGELDVLDTGAIMAASAGEIVPNAATTGLANPYLIDLTPVIRTVGMATLFRIRNYSAFGTNGANFYFGHSRITTPAFTDARSSFAVTNNGLLFLTNPGGASGVVLSPFASNTFYKLIVILRTAGAFYVNGDSGVLYWIDHSDTTNPLYSITLTATGGRHPFGLDYMRRLQLPAPFNTDDGLAMDSLDGIVSAGQTFTASSAYNQTDGDGIHELIITTVPSADNVDYFFRKQDSSNYWNMRVTSAGLFELNEIVAGTPTQRAVSGAGAVTGGERLVLVVEDEVIKGYIGNTLSWTYSSAANFKTETAAELDALGTGGRVDDVKIWPRQLAGDAKTYLDTATA